jgi:hypothetical protein
MVYHELPVGAVPPAASSSFSVGAAFRMFSLTAGPVYGGPAPLFFGVVG